jgi:hypothetical protein
VIDDHKIRLNKTSDELSRGYLCSLVIISTLLYSYRMGGGTAEPTLEDVQSEYPAWHCWRGIAGLLYASRPLTSPPVVVRGEDAMDLRDQIKGWEGRNGHT